MKLSKQLQWILDYLKENKDKGWISPTEIGGEYGKTVGKFYHSSWASPKCRKLVEMNLIKRSKDGKYSYIDKHTIL